MNFEKELLAKGFELNDDGPALCCTHEPKNYSLYYQNNYYSSKGITRSRELCWYKSTGCELCVDQKIGCLFCGGGCSNYRLYKDNIDVSNRYKLVHKPLKPQEIINQYHLNVWNDIYEDNIRNDGNTIILSKIGICELNHCSDIVYALYIIDNDKYYKHELCKEHLRNAAKKLSNDEFEIYSILDGYEIDPLIL